MDSNPRNAFGVYTLSRRAPSTTRPSLQAAIFAAAKLQKNFLSHPPLLFFLFISILSFKILEMK